MVTVLVDLLLTGRVEVLPIREPPPHCALPHTTHTPLIVQVYGMRRGPGLTGQSWLEIVRRGKTGEPVACDGFAV